MQVEGTFLLPRWLYKGAQIASIFCKVTFVAIFRLYFFRTVIDSQDLILVLSDFGYMYPQSIETPEKLLKIIAYNKVTLKISQSLLFIVTTHN